MLRPGKAIPDRDAGTPLAVLDLAKLALPMNFCTEIVGCRQQMVSAII
jgi:hypothetical protein